MTGSLDNFYLPTMKTGLGRQCSNLDFRTFLLILKILLPSLMTPRFCAQSRRMASSSWPWSGGGGGWTRNHGVCQLITLPHDIWGCVLSSRIQPSYSPPLSIIYLQSAVLGVLFDFSWQPVFLFVDPFGFNGNLLCYDKWKVSTKVALPNVAFSAKTFFSKSVEMPKIWNTTNMLQIISIVWKKFAALITNIQYMQINKYAIHAYTHGPVTGSDPSVKPLKYVTHLLVASTPGLGS